MKVLRGSALFSARVDDGLRWPSAARGRRQSSLDDIIPKAAAVASKWVYDSDAGDTIALWHRKR